MKFGLILIILLSFSACNEGSDNETLFEVGTNKKEDKVEECACDELLETESVFFLGENEFTGVCFQNNIETGEKMLDKHFLNGVLNGDIIYYKNDGTVLYKERYEKGKLVQNLKDESINCNCKELNRVKEEGRSKYLYNDQLFTGTCSDLYQNSEQKYMESTYIDGYLNGLSTFFTKDGDVLYLEKYENGQLIKTIYP